MNVQSPFQKFRSLPPHYRYPAIAVAAVVILVAAHAALDRPAPAPAPRIAVASVPAACSTVLHRRFATYRCEHARAVHGYKARGSAALCRYKGQVVGCGCPAESQCAANAKAESKWNALLAKESVGAAPPLPAASTKPSPATTTASVASASTAAAPVPVPVQPPAGVREGLLHAVTEGQDSFGAWLTLSDHVVKSPTLAFAVPALPQGAAGARRVLVSGWVHVVQPVQTVTLRETGPAAVTLTVGGQKVGTGFDNSGTPRSEQVVANLVPGWYLLKAVGTEAPSWASSSSVEVELGSTNLNPMIPVPYWTPAKAPAKAPAAPAPAATTAAPKAVKVATKTKAVPVKAGAARVVQVTKEQNL